MQSLPTTMKQREQVINNYINAYNHFDMDGVLKDLHEDIRFENITAGETNMVLEGRAAFKEQAEKATAFFSERKQTITSIKHNAGETEITIDYKAVLANDFPNGMKKGDILKLEGRSIFGFTGKKISLIKDIS